MERKNKNYAIRNTAAVQYCSLLEIKDLRAAVWIRHSCLGPNPVPHCRALLSLASLANQHVLLSDY